jgi:adenosylcobinamide-GDP ribazoletransferase
MTGDELRGLASDLKIAFMFATRLPLPHSGPIEGADMARASWALPVVGIVVGLIGALAYWIALHYWSLPPFMAAALAVGATMAVTGCLHEDGLGDTFDGFGGGRSRERKLEIMRDSHIGIYSACALILSLTLRVNALASLEVPQRVAIALVVAHAGARAMLPIFMRVVPPARTDGLAADAGRPSLWRAVSAALIGIAVIIAGLGIAKAMVAFAALLIVFGAVRWLCLRQIGGQTGDVMGALEQIGEIALLLTAAAR